MPQLIIVEGPQRGRTFELVRVNTLGSAPSNTVVLSDRRVADVHAEIRQKKLGFEVRAVNVKGPVLLNGEQVREAKLTHGDWITIADTALVYSEDGGGDASKTDYEVRTIDADDLLTSQIRSRRKQYADVDSVIDTLGHDRKTDPRLATLFKVSNAIGEILEKKRLLEKIVDVVFELFRADRCFVMLLDDAGRKLKPVASQARCHRTGDVVDEGAPAPGEISRTILKEVLHTREAVLCTDVEDDARFLSGQSISDQGLRSFMCVPFLNRGTVTGLIQVNRSSDERPCDEDDLDLLAAVAMQAAIAIENANAYQRRREMNMTLRNLNRATQRISSYLERHRILEALVKAASAILRCTKASVLMLEHGRLKLEAAMGFSRELKATIARDEMGSKFCRKVIEDQQPLLVTDVEKELGAKANRRYRTNSFLIVPIVSRTTDETDGECIGVVCVTDKFDSGAFSGNDVEVLSILASQTGIALSNADLYERATVDTLTRVFVRRHFYQRLDDSIRQARSRKEPLALLMLDLDHFKHTNDTYGHQAGDIVLKKVGMLLKKAVRPDDTVARYGGEEFSVILPNTDKGRAFKIAERIRRALANEKIKLAVSFAGDANNGDSPIVRKTASIGVAFLGALDGREELIKKADKACFRAKRGGRNRVEVWDEDGRFEPPSSSISSSGASIVGVDVDETGAFGTDPGA